MCHLLLCTRRIYLYLPPASFLIIATALLSKNLFPWGPSTWTSFVYLSLFSRRSMFLHYVCPVIYSLAAPTVIPLLVWPWLIHLDPLSATTVSSAVSLPWTVAPVHRLQILVLNPPTVKPSPVCGQFMRTLSEFHPPLTPLRPPVFTTSRLCFSNPSYLWYSLGSLYGLPPPPLSPPPTWITIAIQKIEPLVPHLNKTFPTHGYLPVLSHYLSYPSPNIPFPPDVPVNIRQVVVRLVQGYSRVNYVISSVSSYPYLT